MNLFDRHAIKTLRIDHNNQLVGHLPLEVSRATKYMLDRGADVTAQLTSVNYRRSPIIQGGLEIPCIIVVKLNGYSTRNHLLLERYEKVGQERYAEPKDEEIIGSFMIPVTRKPELPWPAARKKPLKRKTNNQEVVGVRDIKTFFNRNRPPANGNEAGARVTQNKRAETANKRTKTTTEQHETTNDCIIID